MSWPEVKRKIWDRYYEVPTPISPTQFQIIRTNTESQRALERAEG